MPKVPVAYEKKPNERAIAAYRKEIVAALRAMGSSDPEAHVELDAAYVAGAYRAKIDPKIAAGVIFHQHCRAGAVAVAGGGRIDSR